MKNPKNPPKPYPSTVSNDELSFAAPYLTPCREDSAQRDYSFRGLFNGLRWLVRTCVSWRMPHDFPPWAEVYRQSQHWLRAGCFEAMANDLRVLVRTYAPAPTIRSARRMFYRRRIGAGPCAQ